MTYSARTRLHPFANGYRAPFVLPRPLGPTGPPPVPVGAREWGVGDRNSKAGPLALVVDGRIGTLSFWFNIALATSGQPLSIGDTNTGIQIKNFGADQMQIALYTKTIDDLAINFVADWTSAGAVWNHIMLSWNHALPAAPVANVTGYLNGVLQVNGVNGATVAQGSVDDDLKYNDAITQGDSQPNGFNFKGCLSEFYLNLEERIDLSIAANRDKFYQSGNATIIGGDGSSVTGSQPAFYAANGELNPNAGKSDSIPVTAGAVVDCADAPNKIPPPFITSAREWDGATRNRRSGSVPTGVTNTRTGILSFWFNADTIGTPEDIIMMCVDQIGGGAIGLQLRRTNFSGGKIVMNMVTTTGAAAITMNNGGSMSVDTWHHFIYTWEYIFPADSAANFKMYFDGVQQLDGVGGANITQGSDDNDIAWAARGNAWTQGSAGANFDGGGFGGPRFLDGCLSNFYLNIDEHLDITIAANLEKFRSALGDPVNLGANGEIPTGNAPAFFAENGELNPNAGYSDNLPVVLGAVIDCADAP